MPKPILRQLNADVVKALNTPRVQQRLAESGIDTAPSTPEQFAALIKSETIKWSKVVKVAGIEPQ